MVNEETIKIELQKTKEDLEDLEMYIKEFSDFLPLAVCTVTPIEIIIDVNKAFEKLTEYKAIEIIGESIYRIFKEKEDLEKALKEAQKKEKINRELTLLSKKKKEISTTTSISVRRDKEGNFIGYFFAITDITRLKEIQEEMKEKIRIRTKELENSKMALMNMLEDVEEARQKIEEEKNRTLSIIKNFTDGILVFDIENKLSLINPQTENFLNVKGENLVGKSIGEFTEISSLKPLANLLGEEIKTVFRKELQIKENLILEVSSVPIIREKEKIGTVVILHDITREKIVERMKSEFVSLAAHQLRTPLSAIKWTLKMLLDGDLGEITEEQREFIEKTYISNERMISLINDLLNVTRIEEGRYLYKPTLVDFELIVQSVIDSYKEKIEKKKIKFGFLKPEKRLPKVVLDIEKIKIAIGNLLDNAISYTLPGGQVTISLKFDKNKIECSIRDTGVGIPKDQQERVFTKFFRGSNVIRMETEGTGLGLFIAKNIIEAHGGEIWFESEENLGTTFYFTIPVKEK